MAHYRGTSWSRKENVSLLYESFGFFTQWPLAALLPAALFFAAYLWKRGALTGLAAGLWVLYTVYEHLMKWRVLCSGDCNIRADLLVLYPALAVVSIAALAEFVIRRKKEKSPDGAL
jgi:hypothetical protein